MSTTRLHCSCKFQKASCSSSYFLGVYFVILELPRFFLGNFDFCLHCKLVIGSLSLWVSKDSKKLWVCICIFLCMLLNYKIKKTKKQFNVLICIWSSIWRTNKIMLYFPWKYKNMFLYIFWNLITDLLKSWEFG